MTIKIENYLLEAETEGGFTLIALSKTKSGKNVGAETRSVMGYNMPFEKCLKNIIHENITKEDVTVSLEKFLDIYGKEVKKIQRLADMVKE